MACNITNTPLNTEPLPLYRRDPETASIRSAAPSYVSEAPTYTSRRPSTTPTSMLNHTHTPAISTTIARATPAPASASASASPPRQGLPYLRYAPGFQSRAHGSAGDLSAHNYNISHWSNIHSNHQSRQYENVARRRASQAANPPAILHRLRPGPTQMPPFWGEDNPAPATAAAGRVESPRAELDSSAAGSGGFPVDTSYGPTSPLEDPYLVGEEAAGRARAQRIYREMCVRGKEADRHESKTWDFMLSQMADWEERERSWGRFRESVLKGKGGGVRF